MIGSTIVIGKPIAAANVLWVSWSSGAKRIVPTVARTPTITRLAISQNPERVSNILRSSTRTTRPRGIAGTVAVLLVGGAWTVGGVVVVMPLSFLVGCRR